MVVNFIAHMVHSTPIHIDCFVNKDFIIIIIINCYSSIINCYSSIINCYSSVINCYSSIINCYSSIINCYSSFINCYSSIINCYSSIINNSDSFLTGMALTSSKKSTICRNMVSDGVGVGGRGDSPGTSSVDKGPGISETFRAEKMVHRFQQQPIWYYICYKCNMNILLFFNSI